MSRFSAPTPDLGQSARFWWKMKRNAKRGASSLESWEPNQTSKSFSFTEILLSGAEAFFPSFFFPLSISWRCFLSWSGLQVFPLYSHSITCSVIGLPSSLSLLSAHLDDGFLDLMSPSPLSLGFFLILEHFYEWKKKRTDVCQMWCVWVGPRSSHSPPRERTSPLSIPTLH